MGIMFCPMNRQCSPCVRGYDIFLLKKSHILNEMAIKWSISKQINEME